MTLLPHESETFVVAREWHILLQSIHAATSNKIRFQNLESEKTKTFVGWVKEDRFRISLRISKPNSFIPLVIGQIEPTSTGCIVFVQYKLFPTTQMYLSFWTFFTVLAGFILTFQYKNYYFLFIPTLVIGAIHWIAWANFKIQLSHTRESLLKILS